MKLRLKLTNYLNRTFLLALLIFAAGCDLLGAEEEGETVTSGVFAVNQGPFGGSGTITVYDPETGNVSNPAGLTGFGAILQSAEIMDGRLFTLASNGERGRVDVFSLDSQERIGQIAPVSNPRYMAAVSPTKAYVTSQLSYYGRPSVVTVINPQTGERIDSVEVGGNADGIAVAGGRAYVATGTFGVTDEVVVINTTTDEVVQTFELDCDAPRFVFADEQEDVFVVCTGVTLYDEEFNVTGRTDGAVLVLDGQTGAEVDRIEVDGQLGTGGAGQDAFYSPEAGELYVVKEGNHILRIDTDNNTFTEIGPITGDNIQDNDIGAVAYDAVSSRLYVAHVDPTYTIPGIVTIHGRNGAETGRFTAGIAPAYLTFRRDER